MLPFTLLGWFVLQQANGMKLKLKIENGKTTATTATTATNREHIELSLTRQQLGWQYKPRRPGERHL